MTKGPLDLVRQLATILDDLAIPYALGGSMASSLIGEPRSTVDVDIAIKLSGGSGHALLERVTPEFYVPVDAAQIAIQSNSSFNLIDTAHGLKVDLFVLGDSLLDRMQIQRRVNIAVPHSPNGIWVTAPEDQILRKLNWYRKGDGVSDRQWRDVIGILRMNDTSLDQDYLQHTAAAVNLSDLLTAALDAAAT